jgi:hypothetical protein
MNTTLSVLVAILSVALAIFLILAIIVTVQAYKLVHSLQEIAKRAEKVITSAETVGKVFRKSSGPVSLFQFIRSVIDTVAEHKQKEK